MHEAIAKASALIEAMEYIRSFAGKIVVVKLGGSVLDDKKLQQDMLRDIAFMSLVGIKCVIVHGGGKAITRAMNESGLEATWVQGRRYTDERTLTIVEQTLVHKVNSPICETLGTFGGRAMGLHTLSSCVLFGNVLRLVGQDGRKHDLGHVGEVTGVNSELLRVLCETGCVPVVAPLATDRSGEKLNVNADSAAGMVASALRAEKLVMVSDTHGILKDMDDPDSRVSTLDEKTVKKMIDQGTITQPMFPKLEACMQALDNGVGKAHIIDGRIDHSLLLEIYTAEGVGTQLIR